MNYLNSRKEVAALLFGFLYLSIHINKLFIFMFYYLIFYYYHYHYIFIYLFTVYFFLFLNSLRQKIMKKTTFLKKIPYIKLTFRDFLILLPLFEYLPLISLVFCHPLYIACDKCPIYNHTHDPFPFFSISLFLSFSIYPFISFNMIEKFLSFLDFTVLDYTEWMIGLLTNWKRKTWKMTFFFSRITLRVVYFM